MKSMNAMCSLSEIIFMSRRGEDGNEEIMEGDNELMNYERI